LLALLDVSTPTNPLIRFGNSVYFGKIVPRIGALLSDGPAYRYLPRSVSYLPNRDRLCQMLADAGFDEVTHRQLSGGLTQLITATRR
jgi:demethylmenaquinone methyltransferase/2-methoxy-6-polyprenyl-1,4-benzoquinol methylase